MLLRRVLLGVLICTVAIVQPRSHAIAADASGTHARIAVASNFIEVAQILVDRYAQASDDRIGISAASTGKLYAQIRNGAPFDVLLAADNTTAQRLVDEAMAVRASLYDYASGQLVLWSRDPTLAVDGERALREHQFHKFAIANPELAPYGAAARAALQHIGRWDTLKSHLVLGENVGQATQFVLSGNAEAGLLPRSLVMQAQKQVGGASWRIPPDWYPPIIQSAVLLKHGSDNPAAIGFLKYLRSDAARAIITTHGYN